MLLQVLFFNKYYLLTMGWVIQSTWFLTLMQLSKIIDIYSVSVFLMFYSSDDESSSLSVCRMSWGSRGRRRLFCVFWHILNVIIIHGSECRYLILFDSGVAIFFSMSVLYNSNYCFQHGRRKCFMAFYCGGWNRNRKHFRRIVLLEQNAWIS